MFRAEVVSEWCQHCDEPIASIGEGKDTEFVKDILSAEGVSFVEDVFSGEDILFSGDGGEQLANVILINALREESNDFEKPSGVGTKVAEHW